MGVKRIGFLAALALMVSTSAASAYQGLPSSFTLSAAGTVSHGVTDAGTVPGLSRIDSIWRGLPTQPSVFRLYRETKTSPLSVSGALMMAIGVLLAGAIGGADSTDG